MRLMRTLSICAAALAASVVTAIAADMPSKQAPNRPADPVSNSWSGFYVGAGAGGAWLDSDPSLGNKLTGYTYNGFVGLQHQVGWFVGGIETGITNFANVKANGFGCDCLVADLVAKVGVTVTPNLLAYGIAGGFWHNASVFGLPQFGWTVGGGLDWQPFNNHFGVGARYQYYNLDVPNTALTVFAHKLEGRLYYKF